MFRAGNCSRRPPRSGSAEPPSTAPSPRPPRSTVVLSAADAQVVRVDTPQGVGSAQSPGQKARIWFRFVHTGEQYGVVGQTLAAVSDRPETFKGYHFAIMDTDEINAFSAPGGLVMISKGMIRCCRNEDALAAVLALRFLADDVVAQLDAFIADEHRWARNQLAHLMLALAAERTVEKLLAADLV